MLACVRTAQHAKSFGVGSHDSVLDAVVDHLHEVTGAVRSAVKVAALGRAAELLAPGRAFDVARAGCQGGENRIEALHDVALAADHHAVAALQAEHAAAGSYVDIVDVARG